jgi:hypothetical protein
VFLTLSDHFLDSTATPCSSVALIGVLNASAGPLMSVDLRLPAVLSVGVTGHRELISDLDSIEQSILTVLNTLRHAVHSAAEEDAAFFSPAKPKIRFATMAAEGADLSGANAAIKAGADVALIMPFAWDEYCADFQPANLSRVHQFLASASSCFELPGRRDEGPRAYERANDVILENIDLLIAVWDGERARGRAGTGDVVQRAATMGLPIIVIDPKQPGVPTILEAPNDQNLAPSQVTELNRTAVSDDLAGLVKQIMCPPADRQSRQALRDLLTEQPHKVSRRFEYRILTSWLAKEPNKNKRPSTSDVATETVADSSDMDSVARNTAEFAFVSHCQRFIDDRAVVYGDLFRSSSVSAYFLVVAGALLSGTIWLVLPWLSTTAIAVQALVNGLVLLDTAFGTRRRWQERWLEYRVVAQRLRWICLLHPLGLSVARPVPGTGKVNKDSWVNWYVSRSARSLGPPTGVAGAAYLASATGGLQKYIRHQSSYHHLSLRRLGLLEARLSLIAHAALIASLFVAAALGVEVVRAGDSESLGWKPVAILLLTILPATTTAMNGLRAEMDLSRLIERSAQTAVRLARINRALSSAPVTYDRLAVAASRSSTIMDNEMSEWRFVLENRRARVGRKHRSIVSRVRRWISKR